MKKHLCHWLLSFGLLCLSQAHAASDAATGYSFGFPPVQSAVELAKRWTPIMQYLTEKTGVPIRFQTAKDIETFQQQMRDGAYDFAFVHPMHYLRFHKLAGYNAFAGEKDGETVGLIITRKNANITQVSQLQGQTLAFPSPNAAAATLTPMQFLKIKDITVVPKYVNSLDSVYLSVAKGLFVAGGGEGRTLSAISPDIRDQLQILWSADPTPSFIFSAHPRVPPEVVSKVQTAMDDMDKSKQGMDLLKAIKFKGIDKTRDSDYDNYRKTVAKNAAAAAAAADKKQP